jgi:hypothetical protein
MTHALIQAAEYGMALGGALVLAGTAGLAASWWSQ